VVADLRAGRILKGETPADFPILRGDQVRAGHQPADRQGIEHRHSPALARADEVIE
jgi:hypothetical protein